MKTIFFASMLWLSGFSSFFDLVHPNHPTSTAVLLDACPSPTGLMASNQTGTAALLTWGAVAGAGTYQIEVENGSGNASFFKVTANIAGTAFTVNGLLPTMNYKFKVRSRCGGDKSNWSGWYSFNSSTGTGSGGNGGGACITPGGTSTTNISPTGAKLNWNSVAGVSGYRINIENASGNPNPLNLTVNLTSGTTNYLVSGLVAGKAYKWKVRSLCGTQTSAWSANKIFVTLP